MKEFTNIARIWLVVLIIAMLLTVYLIVYLPMVNNLKTLTVENMHMAAHYKMTILQREINQSVVGSRGISTRSLLRESLSRYWNGELSLEELRQISQNRFTDGIDTLENLKSAFRITDGQIIAKYNEYEAFDVDISVIDEVTYSIDTDKNELQVISPISSGGQVIGHDLFLFDLKPTVEKLDMEGLKGTLISEDEMNNLSLTSNYIEIGVSHVIIEDNDFIYHIEAVNGTGSYLYIPADKDALFYSVRKMTITNTFTFLGIGVLFVLASNLITTKLAKRKILDLETGREMYKAKYLVDPLTGAYTRRVLFDGEDENLISDDFKGVAVMMDLNDFKTINDNHGHQEGDRVLVRLVEIMKEALRDKDLVIRYGGDEFLVLLKDCDLGEAGEIIERIRNSFKKQPEFGYNIDFDYGMEYFNSLDKLSVSIEKSDKKMYEQKVRD